MKAVLVALSLILSTANAFPLQSPSKFLAENSRLETTAPDPQVEAERLQRVRDAEATGDLNALMDEWTPDEAAAALGLPSQAELEAMDLQDPSRRVERASNPSVVIDVNVSARVQSMHVTYPNGFYDFEISSARDGYTNALGEFTPQDMYEKYYSHKYHNSPMPHAIFFRGGYAIHGTYSVQNLGQPASHGCIRLSPKDAATLYELVSRYGKSHTSIRIHR